MDLEQLVGSASRGNQQAFASLVSKFERPIRGFLSVQIDTKLRGRTDVDDLLQETFLSACQALSEFEWQGETAFKSWLLRIAQNVLRAHQRNVNAGMRNVRREVVLGSGSRGSGNDLTSLLAAVDPTPSKLLRREERFKRLREALLSLSPLYREVIVLVRLDGLSLKEVASRLDRSPGAVSMLLVRALRALRRAFGDTESAGLPDRRLRDAADVNDADDGL